MLEQERLVRAVGGLEDDAESRDNMRRRIRALRLLREDADCPAVRVEARVCALEAVAGELGSFRGILADLLERLRSRTLRDELQSGGGVCAAQHDAVELRSRERLGVTARAQRNHDR